MSKQKAPYFYKTGKDTYHWEMRCGSNHYKKSNEHWHMADKPPKNRTPCRHCTDKPDNTRPQYFWDRQK